jgi:hypothetical protein
MATDRDYVKDYDEAYKHAYSMWGPWLTEAQKDLKFYLGDQWNATDKAYLTRQRRTASVWNKVRRTIHLCEGLQRKNRLSLLMEPIEGGDEKTADQLSALAIHTMQYYDGYHILSDCFSQGPLKTGLNLLTLYVDYGDDLLSGDIRFSRRSYNQFLLDPSFTTRDLSNCDYILLRDWFSEEAVTALLPEHKQDIEEMTPVGADGKFTYYPTTKDLFGQKKYRWDEFYQRTYKTQTVLIHPEIGSEHVWPYSKKELDQFMRHPEIARVGLHLFEKQMPTVELSIILEDNLMYQGPELLGIDDYPHVAFIGFYDPEYDGGMDWKLQSLTRCMRDPQTETNKRRLKMIDMIDSVVGSGLKLKEGSLVYPDDAYAAGQGLPLWINEDFSTEDVQQLQPPNIPPGLFQLSDMLDKDLEEIPGANSELFGMPERDTIEVAGFLSKLRQNAGLTILQNIFDFQRLAKKHMGRKLVKAFQAHYEPTKIARIIGEQPTQQFYNKKFEKYDCVPTEGVISDTQRHIYFIQLLNLRQMGAPIPWMEIIEAAPIVMKDRLKKAIEGAEKAQQDAMQTDKQMQELTNRLMQSKIVEDIASAQSKRASVGEKRTQARENLGNMALDRVRVMKELQNMDADRLTRLLDAALKLEQLGRGMPGQTQGTQALPAPQSQAAGMVGR